MATDSRLTMGKIAFNFSFFRRSNLNSNLTNKVTSWIATSCNLQVFQLKPTWIKRNILYRVSKLGDLVAQELHHREIESGLASASPPHSPRSKHNSEHAPASNESGYKSSPHPSDTGNFQKIIVRFFRFFIKLNLFIFCCKFKSELTSVLSSINKKVNQLFRPLNRNTIGSRHLPGKWSHSSRCSTTAKQNQPVSTTRWNWRITFDMGLKFSLHFIISI